MEAATTAATAPKVHWKHVLVYYILACAISWPFFWIRDMEPGLWQSWGLPNMLLTAAYMWGPGISGIVCLVLFRRTHKRTITFAGTNWLKSCLFWFLPLLILAALGLKGENGKTDHITPLALSAVGFLTIYGEEVGWRGFLQDALRPMNPAGRYLLIAAMWEIWHFTNRTRDKNVLGILATWAILIAILWVLSFIIGYATDRSRSIMVAAALHAWLDLMFEYSQLNTYISFGMAVIIWLLLLWKWKKPLFPQKAGTKAAEI